MISRKDALKIDPLVRGYGEDFIWSPTTSVVDSKALVKYLAKELESTNTNITIMRNSKYMKSLKSTGNNYVVTEQGEVIEAKYLINAAG